jgi:transposase-like protein
MGGRSIAAVARDHDLPETGVRRWVAQAGDRRRDGPLLARLDGSTLLRIDSASIVGRPSNTTRGEWWHDYTEESYYPFDTMQSHTHTH